jgi:hypothetical protein
MAAVLLSRPPGLPSSVPPGLAAVVSRALSREPLLRYPSCREFKTAFENVRIPVLPDAGAFAGGIELDALATTLRLPAALTAGTGTVLTARALRAIAVLPFTDQSPERDQGWFCEGLAEETIGALSRVPGLRVVSRASSFRFNSDN